MLWEAVISGLVVGWLRKGRIKNLNQIDVSGWPLIIAALSVQGLIWIDFNFQLIYLNTAYPFLYTGSFFLLLLFVFLHRDDPGLVVIGAGIMLNLVVIAANGGMMPVNGTTLPPEILEALAEGHKSPFHTPMNSQTVFALLGDRIPLFYRPNQLLSLGDLVIGAGVFIFVQQNMIDKRAISKDEYNRIEDAEVRPE